MKVSEVPRMACRITLSGPVQGIGLRPAVACLAQTMELAGYVRNVPAGAEVCVEGPEGQISEFRIRLLDRLPQGARSAESFCESIPLSGAAEFVIQPSLAEGPMSTRVPVDQSTCAGCLAEVASADNRRSSYAFNSCTDCGPRYSIIEAMPWDRDRTSMVAFAMCSSCAEEYQAAGDRRFHAQTNACSHCGPTLWTRSENQDSDAILNEAAEVLRTGAILAIRGLGGYQLLVDATSSTAVAELRRRKQRRSKPLAVMVKSLEEAEGIAKLSCLERSLLTGIERPIVVVAVENADQFCEEVNPGLSEIGLFLPTTSLHWLLLDLVGKPLVVTSGNIDGEPLASSPEEAESMLRGIADAWVHHDREIVRPIDDSVVRIIAGRPVTVRNGRGLAPIPLPALEKFAAEGVPGMDAKRDVLATGGHQKGAVALFNGSQAILGPHIGDLESLKSRQRYIEHVDQLKSLYRCQTAAFVHDAHPDYFTTDWAAAVESSMAIQHHHAHIVSCMVENDWLDREVLGVAFDGTGYGTDGTIWGGEFLRATVDGFERVAHLRPFTLPGGDSAVRKPWRVAASLLLQSVGREAAIEQLATLNIEGQAIKNVLSLCGSGKLAPITSSAGRLFDGVAALVLGMSNADFEGHAAMLLETVASSGAMRCYEFDVTGADPKQVDWRPMIAQLLSDLQDGASKAELAEGFHRGLAQAIANVAERYDLPVVLTGGVFQNRRLTELTVEELGRRKIETGLHSKIPPNDGGLAAGQLAIGIARLKSGIDPAIPSLEGEF